MPAESHSGRTHGALALVLIGGLSGILYQWHQADAARREAVANAAQARQVLSELIQSSPVTPMIDDFPQPPSIEPLLKAAEHCRELLQNNPEDTELRIALTNVYGRLGTRYFSLGQSAEEATAFVRASQLWESPSPRVAAHPDFRYWLGTTRYWRGGLALRQEESALGCQWLLSADEIWEQLGEEQPDNLDVLAKATSVPQRLAADNGHEFTRGSVPAVPRSAESAIGATIPGILQQPGSAAESGAPQAPGLDLPRAGQRP